MKTVLTATYPNILIPNHSTDDMSILGLLYAPVDTTKRKTLEKRLIFNLKTLYPSGLNKQFTYLQ